jgi:(p)ppGpp synthase/HD superfamily hydrolase
MTENKLLVTKAELLAKETHARVNQTYDGKPYYFHLKKVYANADYFKLLIPEEDHFVVLAAAWAHDMIEDCRYTYKDLKKDLGVRVADIVYACTDEKGRTREERKNEKFFNELVKSPLGVYVKLCDLKANMEYSASRVKGNLWMKYRNELPHTKEKLAEYRDAYAPIWQSLENLK